MIVDILCSDRNHPAWPLLERFCNERGFRLISSSDALFQGDYLFLVSCTEILSQTQRILYKHVLVLHESDLPEGRGWSPLAWQVLEGKSEIVITLFEATDKVDDGPIWVRGIVKLEGHELAEEIAARVFAEKAAMIDIAVKLDGPDGAPVKYRRRTPEDSRLDPNKTIAEQFDLLRICEPRFPAFFEIRGHRYEVTVKKA